MERDEARKALRDYLGRAQDTDFLRLIWSVDALQSDRPELAAKHMRFPAGAAKPYMETRLGIYPWDLEILATSLFLGRKIPIGAKKPSRSCTDFREVPTQSAYCAPSRTMNPPFMSTPATSCSNFTALLSVSSHGNGV